MAFGILYAPAQALMYGMNFEQTMTWVVVGLPFDILHAVGDFIAGMLILPLSELLERVISRQNNF